MSDPGPRRYRADFLNEWAYLQWLDTWEKAIAAYEREEGMTAPQKFRKKPAEITAMQWDGTVEGANPIIDWVLSTGTETATWSEPHDEIRVEQSDGTVMGCPASIGGLFISTLEGRMRAEADDWIIRGVAGEFYPCKPGIFAKTYEAVTDCADDEVRYDTSVITITRSLLADGEDVFTVTAIDQGGQDLSLVESLGLLKLAEADLIAPLIQHIHPDDAATDEDGER